MILNKLKKVSINSRQSYQSSELGIKVNLSERLGRLRRRHGRTVRDLQETEIERGNLVRGLWLL
jgi:hypothetical protein